MSYSWDDVAVTTDNKGRKITTVVESGKVICGAKTRQGRPCPNPPVSGRNRCRLHGGMSLAGADHPNAKTLRYSRYGMPPDFLERYAEAAIDPKLTELRDELAVLQARLSQLLESIDDSVSLEAWPQLKHVYKKFSFAMSRGDKRGTKEALSEFNEIIENGVQQYNLWRDVERTIQLIEKVAKTERRREVELEQMLTADQAINLINYIIAIIKDVSYKQLSPDQREKFLRTISSEIHGVLVRNSLPSLGGSIDND